ncbi:hypothetical protein K439DRAFT_1374058 [Ramaria rubella]|nr:hypothetical protein K439DRAFT_1374058 [Ramaria rubella]
MVYSHPEGGTRVFLCPECYASLNRATMPRFVLKNCLYRGILPDQLNDLTWVEEMVCSLYRNTAHITHLYESTDPSQPRVFHGNTCAHEMNIVSTAQCLPRMPADINGMLSVVFVGPGKFDPEKLGNVFHVRKMKIWSFLRWLKTYNILYQDIPLDEYIMNQYPDNGILPGLCESVISDINVNTNSIFQEETAGFTDHPTDVFRNDCDTSSSVLLKKMGVSGPEGDHISG